MSNRYDFPEAIAELGHSAGLFDVRPVVEPIATRDFPVPARRPGYSVLDKSSTCEQLGLRGEHWRVPLKSTIEELAHA